MRVKGKQKHSPNQNSHIFFLKFDEIVITVRSGVSFLSSPYMFRGLVSNSFKRFCEEEEEEEEKESQIKLFSQISTQI